MKRIASQVILIAAAFALRATGDVTDLRGAVFRDLGNSQRIKVVSEDELEFTPERDGPNLVCKYSRDGESLRVIATVLGSPQAVYFKLIPEGLQRADGTILYDATHFDAASKAAAAERDRRLAAAAAVAVAASPNNTPAATRPIAISAPRPDYPYEARSRKITGAGVAVITISPHSGAVTDVTMAQSTGSPILDNAIVSAFFGAGNSNLGRTTHILRIPISYTMTGATYKSPN